MPAALSAAPAAPSAPGLSARTLYDLGLEHVQRLSGLVWTDYNVHDPGVTTLELLCYALTDLSYRASLPIEDLLSSSEGGARPLSEQFFTPGQVLRARPFTTADFRKLLIDCPGVKNAWIADPAVVYFVDPLTGRLLPTRPAGAGVREVRLRGLHRARIAAMEERPTEERKAELIREATRRLHANRPLGEDFVAVEMVETQGFRLCGRLELAPAADPTRVEAEILYRVQGYLDPLVPRYTLAEIREKRRPDGSRWAVEEIFAGPALDHGFIDEDELAAAELRTTIHLSDIIGIVMGVEGVRAARDLVLQPDDAAGALADPWAVKVAPGHLPVLLRDRCRLAYDIDGVPVGTSRAAVEELVQATTTKDLERLEHREGGDLAPPPGRDRGTGVYYSFQNHFPALYGLSDAGVPSGADDQRRAQALQLKGYLSFFDQVMADDCAQLSHVRDLFSFDPQARRTYFAKVVDSFRECGRILGHPRDGPAEAGKDEDLDALTDVALRDMVEDEAAGVERRNRFLDHLIARFGERFHDYANLMRAKFGAGAAGMIEPKCQFLREYPGIGADRALGYDHTLQRPEDLWNTDNISGLERRLSRLLDIANASRRNLSDVTFDVYAQADATPGDQFRFRVRHRITEKILLSGSTFYSTSDDAIAEMREALRVAQSAEGYERKVASDGTFYFNVVDPTGEVVARRIEYFESEAARDGAVADLIAYVREHYSGEGMYVIENILLRPDPAQPLDPFLPVPADVRGAEEAEDDPYSYRLHVILPAFAGRFRDMDFRRFVERTIRLEVPAHVLPKICWIDAAAMARFEKAYREWLQIESGARSEDRTGRLTRFIRELYIVKNVYPSATLGNRGDVGDRPAFVLGRTALGSGPAPRE